MIRKKRVGRERGFKRQVGMFHRTRDGRARGLTKRQIGIIHRTRIGRELSGKSE